MKFSKPLAGFQKDVDDLGDLAAQRMALTLLLSVRDDKVVGEPLSQRAGTADLSDCKKVYFDPVGGQKPRFRLVYRVALVGGMSALQPVAVGRREDLDAYIRAARNLGRI